MKNQSHLLGDLFDVPTALWVVQTLIEREGESNLLDVKDLNSNGNLKVFSRLAQPEISMIRTKLRR